MLLPYWNLRRRFSTVRAFRVKPCRRSSLGINTLVVVANLDALNGFVLSLRTADQLDHVFLAEPDRRRDIEDAYLFTKQFAVLQEMAVDQERERVIFMFGLLLVDGGAQGSSLQGR